MDAVEAAIRMVESNEADHFVGVGGLPNLLGEVELDASVMDGATRRAGAVAAVKGFPHPISIARAVCERLPQHLLLVGAGAEQFADEVGIVATLGRPLAFAQRLAYCLRHAGAVEERGFFNRRRIYERLPAPVQPAP